MKNRTELYFYPVGDLVNKLSNYGKDNITHKHEIKYDKNKNLKIKHFLSDIKNKSANQDEEKLMITEKEKKEDSYPELHQFQKQNKVNKEICSSADDKSKELIQEKKDIFFENKVIISKKDNEIVEKIFENDITQNLKRKKNNSIKKFKKKNKKEDSKSKDKTNKKITNFFKK